LQIAIFMPGAGDRNGNLTGKEQPGAWILKAFAKGGVDTGELSRRLPGPMDLALRSPEMLTPDMVNTILLECASLSGDGDFGLRMIELTDSADLGLYGYLLMNAPTVGEALEIACRYYPTFYLGAALGLSVAGAAARLTYRVKAPATVSARHDNEWTLGFMVRLIRRGAADNWTPETTTFTHPAPRNRRELRQVFGPDLRFRQAVNSMEFSADVLRYRIGETDPGLLRVLTQHADKLLAGIHDEDDLVRQVRLLILESLDRRRSDEASIAGKLGVSVSTLKRRLKQTGLTYRELRDGVVEDIAKSALSQTRVPVSEIALRVGYSELSAFDRAFVRLTGMTPLEYRAREARRDR
jgi:AraC-like DNA-binding protein